MDDEQKIAGYLRVFFKTSIIVALSLGFAKLLGYVYKLIIARNFGPEGYGLFTLSLMIVGFLASIAALGLGEGLVRYISLYRSKKDKDKVKYLINKSVKISLLFSIIISVLLFILSDYLALEVFNDARLSIFLKIFSLYLPLTILSSLYISVLRAYEKVILNSILGNVLQTSLRVVLLLFLVFIGLNVVGIAYSYVMALLLFTIITYYYFNKYVARNLVSAKRKEDKKIFKQLMNYSWPLMFASAALSLFFWVDSFVIGIFMDVESVGLYGAAITIVSLLGLAPELFVQLFLPIIVKEYSKKNIGVVRQLTKQITKWIFIVNLPLAIFIFFFPGVIINILFGADFLPAENALRILVAGSLIFAFTSILNNLLSMKGRSKLILTNFVVFVIINLILNLILVPRYGIIGAAIATAASQVLLISVITIQTINLVKIFPFRRKIIYVALAAVMPSLLLIYLSNNVVPTIFNLIISGSSFVLLYLLIILIVKGLDRYDLGIITSLINRGKSLVKSSK